MAVATIKKSTQKEVVTEAVKNPLQGMRSLVRGNLYLFLRYFWPEYSEDAFSDNWHIKYICDELERVARRVANNQPKEYDLVINVPPGSTKTAIVSIMFPIWVWVNWHHIRFITASYTASLSLESAERSRDIIRSPRFRSLFPEYGIKADKDTKSNFRVIKRVWERDGRAPQQKVGGNRYSTSVGGAITGFHGHINIVDDPIDPMRAVSDTEIKKANYWMDNVLPFRKVDKSVTATIMIMQRLHQSDPTGHWIEEKEEGEVKHICIPGEIKNFKENVKPQELSKFYKDDLMDPIRLNWDALRKLENLGQYTYSGQVGQNPVPLGGGMFKIDFLTYIEQPPQPIEIVSMVRYWDKAGSEGDGAYTVGVKIAKLKTGRFIVLDVKRGQWGSNKRERIIRATAEADGQHCKVYVEQEPGSGGKESAENTIRNLAGFSVYRDRPTGDKALRADPYSVQVNEGNVSLLRGEWNKAYVDEMKFFPNSTYKDQIDASSGAFSKLTALKKVTVVRR